MHIFITYKDKFGNTEMFFCNSIVPIPSVGYKIDWKYFKPDPEVESIHWKYYCSNNNISIKTIEEVHIEINLS